MNKNKKTLDLDEVRESWAYLDNSNLEKDPLLVTRVMGSLGIIAGTTLAGAGGISMAAENPAGVEVLKTGVALAAIGAGALTVAEISDEIINHMGNNNDENSESSKSSLLPFSKRRADKYKNTENIVQSIAESIDNKTKSNLTKNSSEVAIKKVSLGRDQI